MPKPPKLSLEALHGTPLVVLSAAPPDVSRFQRDRLRAGLFALLLFGPLAFGAVEPWSIAILELGSAALFLWWWAVQARTSTVRITISPLFGPMALFAAVVIAQLIAGTTIYPYGTMIEARKYAAYALLVVVAVHTLNSERSLRKLAWTLTLFGFVLALFAILQGFTSNGALYWVRRPSVSTFIYGPYVNRNHYSGLMEMLVAVPLALAAGKLLRGEKRALAGFAALIMAASIFLSQSRAGIAAFLAQLIFLAGFNFAKHRSRQLVVGAAMVFLCLTAFLLWLDSNQFIDRFAQLSARDEIASGRLAISLDTVHMWLQKPLLGWGLDTFPLAYPGYRGFYTNFYVNAVHNDYLQVLVETGAVGALAMLWLIFAVFRHGLPQARKGRDYASAMKLAALTGCVGILAHSFADFNLHIPANAALFYVFCAVATAHVRRSPASARPPVT